MAQDTTNVVSQ